MIRSYVSFGVSVALLVSCGGDTVEEVDSRPATIAECAAEAGASVEWNVFGGAASEDNESYFDLSGAPLDAASISDRDVAIYRECMESLGIEFVSAEEVEHNNLHVPAFVECIRARGYTLEVTAPERLTGQIGYTSYGGQKPNDVIDADTVACVEEVGWNTEVVTSDEQVDDHD